jgi:flagellar biosynthesis/type III secretory pathway protein FliH
MTESLVSETIENKIIEIAAELAGYQIDKMPEKYEKKIKSFLKNINCFDEKIAIETNDQDYKALSKIEDFKNLNKDIKFIPNSQISRGDVILNCDGMYYSEKTVKNNQGVKKIK